MATQPDAETIRRLREACGWPQEQLADVAGVSLRTVQRAEKGKVVSRDSLSALAAAFDRSLVDLTDDAEARAAEATRQEAARGLDALRLSFLIHAASFVFGMIVFAAISLGDGAPGYVMLAPTLWWTVGLAGHALAVVLAGLVARFGGSRPAA